MKPTQRVVRWAMGFTGCDQCGNVGTLHVEELERPLDHPLATRKFWCWRCFKRLHQKDGDPIALAEDAQRILTSVADQAHNLFKGGNEP